MKQLEVIQRSKKFINELGVKQTVFCKNIDIAVVTYYKWCSRQLDLSQSTLMRISDYLSKYGF